MRRANGEHSESRIPGRQLNLTAQELATTSNLVTEFLRPFESSLASPYQNSVVVEVSPKNALETIIRHFTDTRERKREGRELTHIAGQEARRAQELSVKPRDYTVADRVI